MGSALHITRSSVSHTHTSPPPTKVCRLKTPGAKVPVLLLFPLEVLSEPPAVPGVQTRCHMVTPEVENLRYSAWKCCSRLKSVSNPNYFVSIHERPQKVCQSSRATTAGSVHLTASPQKSQGCKREATAGRQQLKAGPGHNPCAWAEGLGGRAGSPEVPPQTFPASNFSPEAALQLDQTTPRRS